MEIATCRQVSLAVMKMMRMVMAEVVVMMVKHREKHLWQKWIKCILMKKRQNDGDEYDQGDNDTWKRWQQVSGYKELLQYMVLHTHTHKHTKIHVHPCTSVFKYTRPLTLTIPNNTLTPTETQFYPQPENQVEDFEFFSWILWIICNYNYFLL